MPFAADDAAGLVGEARGFAIFDLSSGLLATIVLMFAVGPVGLIGGSMFTFEKKHGHDGLSWETFPYCK